MKLSGLQRWQGSRAVPGMPLTGTAVSLGCPETWALRRGGGGQGTGVPPDGLCSGLVFMYVYREKQGSKGSVL